MSTPSDLTKTGPELVYELLNLDNPTPRNGAFTPTNVELGTPTVVTGGLSGRNTNVVVTAIPGMNYSGTRNVKYNRLNIQDVFIAKGVPALEFLNDNYVTSEDILPYINSTYGLNLLRDDVVVEDLPPDDDITGNIDYTLTMRAESLTYYGSLPLTIKPAVIQLQRAFKMNLLNGFVPPDTTRINLATALTQPLLDCYTVSQLTAP